MLNSVLNFLACGKYLSALVPRAKKFVPRRQIQYIYLLTILTHGEILIITFSGREEKRGRACDYFFKSILYLVEEEEEKVHYVLEISFFLPYLHRYMHEPR